MFTLTQANISRTLQVLQKPKKKKRPFNIRIIVSTWLSSSGTAFPPFPWRLFHFLPICKLFGLFLEAYFHFSSALGWWCAIGPLEVMCAYFSCQIPLCLSGYSGSITYTQTWLVCFHCSSGSPAGQCSHWQLTSISALMGTQIRFSYDGANSTHHMASALCKSGSGVTFICQIRIHVFSPPLNMFTPLLHHYSLIISSKQQSQIWKNDVWDTRF